MRPKKTPPAAIVVPPCFHAPCLDTGVSGDTAAACPCFCVAVAVTGSGCALTGHPAAPPTPHVLGEPKVTPLAVGQPAPAGTGELGAVSCANARRCWAVGVAGPNPAPAGVGTVVIVATTNGGTSWKAQHVAGGSTPQLSGISCPTPTECMAVGSNGASLPGSGVVVTTTDAGTTWSPAMSPPECPRGQQCRVRQPVRLHRHRQRRHGDVVRPQRRLRAELATEGRAPLAVLRRERSDVRRPAGRASSPATSRPATDTARARSH